MKMAEITPGLYAVPALTIAGYGGQRGRSGYSGRWNKTRGGGADARNGTTAAPVRVLAVGKFRWKQSGICASEIVEDHYQTTVKVEVVDVLATLGVSREEFRNSGLHQGDTRIGYPDGLKLNSKKIVWKEDILTTADIIMPWDAFLTRHDEHALIQLEVDAYNARLREIETELANEIASIHESKKALSNAESTTSMKRSVNVGRTYEHAGKQVYYANISSEDVTHVQVTTTTTVMSVWPVAQFPKIEALQKEAAGIREKLSCSVR